MASTRAEMINSVEAALQDSSNTVFSAAEVEIGLVDALRQLSEYVPHEEIDVYTLEMRTGSATATSANHLVDTTKLQFKSSDVGKWLYNSTDKVWAVITAYNSTSDVTISKDIFANGEAYSIFNAGCNSIKQINIASSLDNYLDIIAIEWPRGKQRNYDLLGDILTLDLDSDPVSTDDPEVWIRVNRPHGIYDGPETQLESSYTITSSAVNGTIDPDGETEVTTHANQTFTITPGRYGCVTSITVDDVVVDTGPYDPDEVVEYTFTDVTADHTIVAKCNSPA